MTDRTAEPLGTCRKCGKPRRSALHDCRELSAEEQRAQIRAQSALAVRGMERSDDSLYRLLHKEVPYGASPVRAATRMERAKR